MPLSHLVHPFQFRPRDARGQNRRVPFPNLLSLHRQKLPRPFRLFLHIISWRMPAVVLPIAMLAMAAHLLGFRLWSRHVVDPWMAAATANPGAAAPPPSMIPLFAAQFSGIALMAAAFLALTPTLNRALARRYTTALLRLARCPWCSYDLSGSPAEDGLTTCPECGGIWEWK
ncbi:MAG: hypothetical protein WD749_09205 [Phycisphaerales bacterium]